MKASLPPVPPVPPVFVALSARGLETARRLAPGLPGSEIHGRAGRCPGAEITFVETTDHLRALFESGRPIIGLCAAGILVRALAPLLTDKRAEPPVLALAEEGSAVVPILGGHRGANDLAREIAALLEIAPAITTAGELAFGIALDAPPAGYRLANPGDAKAVMARALAGEAVTLVGAAPWLADSGLPRRDDAAVVLETTIERREGSDAHLVYHPARLALGVGCERGCAPEELRTLVRDSLAEAGLAEGAVAGVFSLDLKADEAAVLALARDLGVPARFFPAATLEAESARLTQPSKLVFREVGCHGVAEGAALAAVGPAGSLLLAKRKSRRATLAVAEAPGILAAGRIGRARGSLAVVGLGPGDPAWRAPAVARAVEGATDLVGYGLYLDLLGALAQGKARHDYALGEEELRVRRALELAAEGRDVALICSGDPGIYAMAALVFELLDRAGRPEWNRVEITVVPGISALQAAAARIGAPLGHDFCAISLSDLLTPWAAIEKRLKAAAEGDFVVAFYNPVSKRRREQFTRAIAILSAHRPADTPVVIGRNLARQGERVSVVRLDQVESDMIDMLTLVLVGSSTTRRVARGDGEDCWVYTPRGYAAKAIRKEDPKNEEEVA